MANITAFQAVDASSILVVCSIEGNAWTARDKWESLSQNKQGWVPVIEKLTGRLILCSGEMVTHAALDRAFSWFESRVHNHIQDISSLVRAAAL